jgi:hypothetical protein
MLQLGRSRVRYPISKRILFSLPNPSGRPGLWGLLSPKMSTTCRKIMFLESRELPVRRADICELIAFTTYCSPLVKAVSARSQKQGQPFQSSCSYPLATGLRLLGVSSAKCYMPRPSHHPWLDHSNYTLRRLRWVLTTVSHALGLRMEGTSEYIE